MKVAFVLQTTDYRLQTTAYRPQTTDHRPQTTDHRLQTTDYGLRTTDYGLRTTDYRLQTTDYRLRPTDHRPQTTYSGCSGIKSESYEPPRKEIWKKYDLPHVEAGVTIVDSELPHVEEGVHFLGSSENRNAFESYLNDWNSKNVENLSSIERRKKTDKRRKISGLKLAKLYLDDDVLTQIHKRMEEEGYNNGRKYKTSSAVNCEDMSEFITYIFNKYKAEKPNRKTYIETHLHKLKLIAEHLGSELTTYGVAEFMNRLGHEKPIYLTNKTVTVDLKDEFSEDVLDLNHENYDPKWTEQDIELLLDDKEVQKIIRLIP